ncbi:hypothetical protein DE146DRAFT_227451 [Phaeosphaeria sp. MPI-PUGE-AT-0046c]|nr:hypothetical protein DE146DRAFT_227451 [Phaeosphaeria sp. MPI-PUGE-AT-0046c]
MPSISLIYVPSDVGSIIPGKSKAPAAFRDVHIVRKLKDSGYTSVSEHYALDSPATYSASTFPLGGVRNEELNISVCERVRDTVTQSLSTSTGDDKLPFQLVLGGECCMLPAVLSAFSHHTESCSPPQRVGLLYIDADTDLSSPTDPGSTGTFASMNMTHLVQNPGCLKRMKQFSRLDGSPVCSSENTVFFGTNMELQSNTRDHFAWLFDNNYKVVSSTSIAKQPEQRAQEALKYLETRVDNILVHLDVDAIDPGMFPLANVPNFTGVNFEQMMRVLAAFLKSDKVKGLSVAEVNPDHDPGLDMMQKLAQNVVDMLATRLE